jgi:hypothetical protein
MSKSPTPSATLHQFAAPMLDVLGDQPKPKQVRQVLEVAVAIWNADTMANWEEDPQYIARARAQILGDYPELIETFDRMVQRRRDDFADQDWGISAWELNEDEEGRFRLAVEARLRS